MAFCDCFGGDAGRTKKADNVKPPAVPAARAPIKGKAPSPARSGSSKAAKEASSAEASSKQQGAKQQRAIAMATAKPAEAKPEDIVLTEATLDMTAKPQLYRITVVTANVFAASTDFDVSIQLAGSAGRTAEIPLDDEKNNFERGETDVFAVLAPSVGEVKSVNIGIASKKTATSIVSRAVDDAWMLASVHVLDMVTGQNATFTYNGWIRRKNPRVELPLDSSETIDVANFEALLRQCSRSRGPLKPKPRVPRDVTTLGNLDAGGLSDAIPDDEKVLHRVVVKTGTKFGAGTDYDISLILNGTQGRTKQITLDDERNNFEAGSVEHFAILTPDVGDLRSIDIGISTKNTHSGSVAELVNDKWQLESVELLDFSSGMQSRFIYHDWIEKKYARATLEPVWQTKVDVSDRERLLQYCSRRVGPLAPKSMSRGLAGLGRQLKIEVPVEEEEEVWDPTVSTRIPLTPATYDEEPMPRGNSLIPRPTNIPRTPYETFAGVPHNWFGPSSSRSFSAAATTPRSTRSAAPLNSARGFWPGPFAKPPADDKWAGLAAVNSSMSLMSERSFSKIPTAPADDEDTCAFSGLTAAASRPSMSQGSPAASGATAGLMSPVHWAEGPRKAPAPEPAPIATEVH